MRLKSQVTPDAETNTLTSKPFKNKSNSLYRRRQRLFTEINFTLHN